MPRSKRDPRLLLRGKAVIRTLRPLLLSLGLAFSAVVHADFNDGVVAFAAGNYEKALQTFIPLAETSDHALAQYFLARMYADGRGVERNADEAAKWYRKAAEKGVKEAQYRLGALYERGEGVPRDLEYAFGWYSVASHLGLAKATAARDAARGNLQGEALTAATALAEDLIAKYGQVPRTTAVEQ